MKLFPEDRCLFCHTVIPPEISWQAIFSAEKERVICTDCMGKLKMIEGDTCQICCRPLELLEDEYRHDSICHDCQRWEEDSSWHGLLEKNTSIFVYNEFLKEVIARYKYRGDYVMAKGFSMFIKEKIQKTMADLVVPIPLSEDRLYERGFNQSAAILEESGIVPAAILGRIHTEKQSKKSRQERIHLPQVFQLLDDRGLQGKNILLIDDIYTTGSTLRHGAKLLKQAGAGRIESLTLAR